MKILHINHWERTENELLNWFDNLLENFNKTNRNILCTKDTIVSNSEENIA